MRDRRWLILAVAFVGTFVLGWVGYSSDEPRQQVAAYRSLQLFGLESGEVQSSPNLAVITAGFLAPLVAAWAVVLAAAGLFREQLQRLWIRFRLKDHVVVAGLGTFGFRLATAFDQAGRRVVVIERDPRNGSIAGCRERGIAVVTGDATDQRLLGQTGLTRARDFLVVCGEDSANLDILVAATRVVPERRARLGTLVHLADLALWRRLQAHALVSPDRFPFRLEFFNVLDAGARVLLRKYPPFGDRPGDLPRRPHLLFVGLEEVGEFAALHAAGRWQHLDKRSDEYLWITVIGPAAGEQVGALLERYPDLAGICRVAAQEIAISDAAFQAGDFHVLRDRPPVTQVYVCLSNEADGLSAALILTRLPETQGAPLVVTVKDAEAGVASLIASHQGRLAEVSEFGVLSRTLVPDVAQLSTREVLSQLRHEEYVRRERERGETEETNSSMVPWDELPDSLKASNRAFADGVGRKLAQKSCALVPAPLATAEGTPAVFTEEEIEALARGEHDRWITDLQSDGWRWTPGEKDPARKHHPLLVPWEDLDSVHKDRDRDSIRALPAMLARVGFKIHRGGVGLSPDSPT